MRPALPALALLSACWGDRAYIVEGTVLEKPSPTRIVMAHEDIPGLMPAMTMPFDARDPSVFAEVDPGERVIARLHLDPDGTFLHKVRVTGQGVIPADYEPVGTGAILPGATLPAVEVPLHDGSTWTVGAGQGAPTVLTFAYTRCPLPDYCPLTTRRLQGLQAALGEEARLLVVTLDPAHDTPEVLAAYAAGAGAAPGRWMYGRLEGEALAALARAAGLSYEPEGGEILHGLRTLVLDAEGALIERYDDNRYPEERVVSQLRTGEPKAPPGSEGTLSPRD